MKKLLKRLLITFSIIAFVLVGGIAIIANQYEDELKAYVTSELNKNLSREVDLSGMEYSFLENFPNISVELTDIKTHSFEKGDVPFLDLKRVHLVFDIFSLFGGEFKLSEIVLDQGQANVIFNKDGLPNYKIWKESGDSTKSSTSLAIELIALNDVAVSYQHWGKGSNYQIEFEDFALNPKSLVGKVDLQSEFKGNVSNFVQGDFKLVDQSTIAGKFNLKYLEGKIDFQFIGNLLQSSTEVTGAITPQENGEDWDIKFSASSMGLTELKSKLPEDIQELLPPFSGNGSFNGSIVGQNYKFKEPSMNIGFEVNNGSVKFGDEELKNIKVKGNYHQPKLSSSKNAHVSAESFDGMIGKSKVFGKGKVSEFNRPLIEADFQTELDLADLHENYMKEDFKALKGVVIMNAELKGRLIEIFKDKKFNSLKGFKSDGKITFNDIVVQPNNLNTPVYFGKGDLDFNNKDLNILSLAGKMNSSEFEMKGAIKNFLKSLIGDAPLSIAAIIKSDQMILEEFINSEGSTEADSSYYFNLPEDLNLDVDLDLGRFGFRKFKAQNIKGKVFLNNQVLRFKQVKMDACSGSSVISGKVASNFKDKVVFECHADVKKIDAKMAFEQLENFGQDFLLAKHVNGTISTDIYLLAETDKQLNIQKDRIYTKTKIRIANGELNQFEPLLELQTFLKDEFKLNYDLGNLKFKTIENDIEIINKMIHIPEMAIRTNDINLDISGTHSFDQEIDYLFKIKHSEIFKKSKQNEIDARYGVVENNDKTATLPLSMTGTVDNPKFSYDMKTKGGIIRDNIKKEGQEIKKIFTDLFKGDDKEEKKEDKDEPKEDLNQERTKTQMQVEWDEDEDDDEEEEEEEDFE